MACQLYKRITGLLTSFGLVRSELPFQSSVKVANRKPAENTLIVITAFANITVVVNHLR